MRDREQTRGLEKRDFMSWIFDETDLRVMARLKSAFKAGEHYNPCKAFPTHKGCGELNQAHIQRVMNAIGGDVYV
jgi:glycolate oxidase